MILDGTIPPSRGGPAWSSDGTRIYTVLENAKLMNPIVSVEISNPGKYSKLETGTQLNSDVSVWNRDGADTLVFTAQGDTTSDEKRWKKIYLAQVDGK